MSTGSSDVVTSFSWVGVAAVPSVPFTASYTLLSWFGRLVPPGFSGLTLTGPLSALTTTGTSAPVALAERERQRANTAEQRDAADHGCNQQAAALRRRMGFVRCIIGGQRNFFLDVAVEIEVDEAVAERLVRRKSLSSYFVELAAARIVAMVGSAHMRGRMSVGLTAHHVGIRLKRRRQSDTVTRNLYRNQYLPRRSCNVSL